MRKGDLWWLAALCAVSSAFLAPASHQLFVSATQSHPYMMGFVKFSILATMGELLAIRIASGEWRNPPGTIYRALLWGVFGMVIVLMFEMFSGGVASSTAKGLLWIGSGLAGRIWTAFWIGAIMNLVFAPTFMTVHRITDTYIDLICGEGIPFSRIQLADVVARIDWLGLISFVVLKSIPFFWIPAHTITFLLPPEYRILVAAYLSIALGAILAYGKRKKSAKVSVV